jgi:hypothetical protein
MATSENGCTRTEVTEHGVRVTLARLRKLPGTCVEVRSDDGYCAELSLSPISRHAATPGFSVAVVLAGSADENDMMCSYLAPRLRFVGYAAVLCEITEDALLMSDRFTDAVPGIAAHLSRIADARACVRCSRRIVPDDDAICLTCSLGAAKQSVDRHYCSICMDRNLAPVTLMACCGKYLHAHCMRQLERCPLCRSSVAQHASRYALPPVSEFENDYE